MRKKENINKNESLCSIFVNTRFSDPFLNGITFTILIKPLNTIKLTKNPDYNFIIKRSFIYTNLRLDYCTLI